MLAVKLCAFGSGMKSSRSWGKFDWEENNLICTWMLEEGGLWLVSIKGV